MKKIAVAGLAIAFVLLPAGTSPGKQLDLPFDGCGVFVQGVECILFQADSGGLYYTGSTYGYEVGDRVHIIGTLWGCVSYCMQEDACLAVDEISSCGVATESTSWGALKELYGLW
jgi:hypothetical protein